MMDPVTVVLSFTAAQVLIRLAEALAQRWTLGGRAELIRVVAQLPAGVKVADRDAQGAGWLVSTAPGTVRR